MKPLLPADYWAVICPNWGEPRVILSTISETPEEAIEKSLVDSWCSMYSGAALSCIPIIKGSWERLQSFGYTVRKITIIGGD